MTEYSDIPESNRLHQESQRVAEAINIIDAGGTLASFMVVPAPSTQPIIMPTMPANITVSEPCSEQLMTALRDWLVERERQLAEQLQALGVTAPPARGR